MCVQAQVNGVVKGRDAHDFSARVFMLFLKGLNTSFMKRQELQQWVGDVSIYTSVMDC